MDESFKIKGLEKGLLDILSDLPNNSFIIAVFPDFAAEIYFSIFAKIFQKRC